MELAPIADALAALYRSRDQSADAQGFAMQTMADAWDALQHEWTLENMGDKPATYTSVPMHVRNDATGFVRQAVSELEYGGIDDDDVTYDAERQYNMLLRAERAMAALRGALMQAWAGRVEEPLDHSHASDARDAQADRYDEQWAREENERGLPRRRDDE